MYLMGTITQTLHIRRSIQPQGVQIPPLPLQTRPHPPPPPPPWWVAYSSLTIPHEISASPPEALKVPNSPLEPRGGPGTAWKRLETPPHAWMKLRNLYRPCISYGLQYILCLIYGFRVWGTLNWDLRWIMTRALLRDTRSVSYRSVAKPQYTCRLLVKCLWTPEAFQAPNAIH